MQKNLGGRPTHTCGMLRASGASPGVPSLESAKESPPPPLPRSVVAGVHENPLRSPALLGEQPLPLRLRAPVTPEGEVEKDTHAVLPLEDPLDNRQFGPGLRAPSCAGRACGTAGRPSEAEARPTAAADLH